MSNIFDLIFSLFEWVISSLRSIPLSDNVSLFDFSFALLIMGITLSAVVITAKSSALNSQSARYRENRQNERKQNKGG
ncbi:MAG: hypothetical protein IJA43_08840 [Clostridia bacterium]|nr:hypothetical protein [Clostridia bacterium]